MLREFSLVVASWGNSLVLIHRLPIAVSSLVAEHRLRGAWASVAAAPRLWSTGLIVVTLGLSCFEARMSYHLCVFTGALFIFSKDLSFASTSRLFGTRMLAVSLPWLLMCFLH